MKDNNYIVIQGWMLNKLELSGNELMVYAIIYGFSQDEESKYTGSGQYIADSLKISRRAVSLLLNSLVEKKFIIKFERNERNIKFCDYQANKDFFPKNKKSEESNTSGGMENISIPRKKMPRGMEISAIGGMEKIATHITIHKYKDTSSSQNPPEANTDPPPETKKEETDFFSSERIKEMIRAIDRSLVLTADFYSKAASFLLQHNLDSGYISWIYKQCVSNEPDRFDSYFYKIFFAENMVEKYKAVHLPAAPPPPVIIKCPVCSTNHDKLDEKCPFCYLPKDSGQTQIDQFRELLVLPPEKRKEFLKREETYISSNKFNFEALKTFRNALSKEFGLTEKENETPSRSFR